MSATEVTFYLQLSAAVSALVTFLGGSMMIYRVLDKRAQGFGKNTTRPLGVSSNCFDIFCCHTALLRGHSCTT